jgi:hypothetical protein
MPIVIVLLFREDAKGPSADDEEEVKRIREKEEGVG